MRSVPQWHENRGFGTPLSSVAHPFSSDPRGDESHSVVTFTTELLAHFPLPFLLRKFLHDPGFSV